MKIRKGFVSNSSSSSYIVVLDDTTRPLANYDWMVDVREYIGDCGVHLVYVEDDDGNFDYVAADEEYLTQKGYKKVETYLHGTSVWENKEKIASSNSVGLSRSTSICFGTDLLDFITNLTKYEYADGELASLSSALKNAINTYGLENIMYIRESDEGSGGYLPDDLRRLTKGAIYVAEYH